MVYVKFFDDDAVLPAEHVYPERLPADAPPSPIRSPPYSPDVTPPASPIASSSDEPSGSSDNLPVVTLAYNSSKRNAKSKRATEKSKASDDESDNDFMHDTDSYAKRQNICMNTHKNGGDFKNTNSMDDIPEAKLTDEHQKMWDQLLNADILTDTASQEIIYLMQDMQLAFQSLYRRDGIVFLDS